MAELVVVHGPPGSGKTSHSERLAKEGILGREVLHVSAGNRLRDIRTGKISSEYSKLVNPAPGTRVLLDHELMAKVIFEFVNHSANSNLVLIDGYPRFADAIPSFLNFTDKFNHNLLGCVNFQIPRKISIERLLARGTRESEIEMSTNFAEIRYQEHLHFTIPAVGVLGHVLEVINVDAEPEMELVWGQFYQSILKLMANK